MEKRTIIAFVLSFLVLVGWNIFFTPKQQPTPPGEETGTETFQKPPQEIKQVNTSKPYIAASEQMDQETVQTITKTSTKKDIRVETPLYIITFSNEGAKISSVLLKQYRQTSEPESPPIELVTIKDRNEAFFSATYEGQNAPTNQSILYEVNSDQILLTQDSPSRDLIFKGRRSDGIEIEQTFRFYPDSYDIGLNVSVKNNSQNTVGGNIRTYLANLPPEKKGSYYSFNGLALFLNNKLETHSQLPCRDFFPAV